MYSLKPLFALAFIVLATTVYPQQSYWKKSDEKGLRNVTAQQYIIPDVYETYSFDFHNFIKILSSSSRTRHNEFVFEMPFPATTFKTFKLVETPVFEKELSDKYPGFYSFTGSGIEGKGSWIKMSVSPFGINVMAFTHEDGYIFIDPYNLHNSTEYIVYNKKDFNKKSGHFKCSVSDGEFSGTENQIINHTDSHNRGERLVGDCILRSYRLALSCTGEYASFHGGTKEKVLAAYNATMTRVNGIYERDVSITMKLVPDVDKIIFLNATTDPFSNNDDSALLDQNQTTIDNLIGPSKYDLGHVFSTGGGGRAELRSPCRVNRKARGVTGRDEPIGDPFDIDYVAHEMGHQFGANHTFNNSCISNRNTTTAVEPGSGSTIMGYAGICEPNVQNNSDSYFHGISLAEIANFVVAGTGNTCAVQMVNDNNKPEVKVAKNSYTIPISTSFFLTGQGSDSDEDNLTYCWEQVNNETTTMPPKTNNTSGPAFRSLSPSNNPTRYFPDLLRRYSTWEVLPNVNRTMNFRCTVRDNNHLGGCTAETNVEVKFSALSGPFVVTYPNSAVSWLVGSHQTVTWNVAKTDTIPINCTKVNIYLSTDGGASYPHILATNVPNNGSFEIETPTLPTTRAKVMVAGADNIFFDVSNTNFRITTTFTIESDSSSVDICDQNSFETFISLNKVQDLSQPVLLSLESAPSELLYSFSPNLIESVPAKSLFTVDGLQFLPLGLHTIIINAISGSEKLSTVLKLFKGDKQPSVPSLLSPVDFSSDVNPIKTKFIWDHLTGIKDYNFEISQTPGFEQILHSATTAENKYEYTLQEGKIYFWRIKGNNPCISNQFSSPFSFRTSGTPAGEAVLLKNEVLIVNADSSETIGQNKLNILGSNPSFIFITITKIPEHGWVMKNGEIVGLGNSFTMEDILLSKLKYEHNGDETYDTDGFRFSILDDQNRWLPDNEFQIRIRQNTLGIAVIAQNKLLCFGDSNGKIKAEAYGGSPPYTYSLDGNIFQTSPEFDGLTSGRYIIHVKDNSDSIKISNEVFINQPEQLNLSLSLDYYDIVTLANGGSGSLKYSINGSDLTDNNIFTDPGNGEYNVKVIDENGCLSAESISIDIEPLNIVASLTNDIVCAGQKATLLTSASGGILPYTYSADGQTFQQSPTFQLNAGKYSIFVKDAGKKIVQTDSIFTANPIPIEVSIQQEKLKITVIASGGDGKLLFSSNGTTYSENNVILFSDNGTYKVYVKDESQCIKQINVSLNVLKDIFKTVRHVSCHNQKDGYIKLQPENGNLPFQYSLNGSPFDANREWSDLAAGPYYFAVKDSKNDTVYGEIFILQPDSLYIDWSTDESDLTIMGIGGTPPYRYSIDGGIVFLDGNVFDELPDGNYELSVIDKNNCIANTDIIVSGIEEVMNNHDFQLVPNPAFSHIRIMSKKWLSKDTKLNIQSISGVDVLSLVKISADGFDLDVSSLSPGVYFVILTSNLNRKVSKFVKY